MIRRASPFIRVARDNHFMFTDMQLFKKICQQECIIVIVHICFNIFEAVLIDHVQVSRFPQRVLDGNDEGVDRRGFFLRGRQCPLIRFQERVLLVGLLANFRECLVIAHLLRDDFKRMLTVECAEGDGAAPPAPAHLIRIPTFIATV